MKIEIVHPEVMSTSNKVYEEIADSVYRCEDGTVMIVDGDKAALVTVGGSPD